MKSKSRIKGAMKDHKANPLSKAKLELLKKKFPDKSLDYWDGYYDGVAWAYNWVLE